MAPNRLFVYVLSACAAVLPSALAQAGAYAQCGGNPWTGPTTCVSGYVCTFSSQWYSQCVPSTGSTTATTSSGSSSTTTTSSSPTSTVKANYWFSFGDSYTQTGFTPSGTLPAVGNPLGNPPYPGFTATGGPNWVDVATVVNNHSTVLTYNYAYGGATIDATLVTPYEPTVLSLTDQVNQFLAGPGASGTKIWTSTNALFSIFIGINDIGNSWYASGDRAAFSDTLLAAQFALVQKLYAVGARNFLFVNVPPIDRSPLMLAQSASDQAAEKAVIVTHNAKLVAKIAAFKAANTGVQTFLWDAAATFTKILNSPTTYGFVDATSFGGATSFWGNNYHPQTLAHVIFGKEVGTLLGSTVW